MGMHWRQIHVHKISYNSQHIRLAVKITYRVNIVSIPCSMSARASCTMAILQIPWAGMLGTQCNPHFAMIVNFVQSAWATTAASPGLHT
jgi:hypothetical protein